MGEGSDFFFEAIQIIQTIINCMPIRYKLANTA